MTGALPALATLWLDSHVPNALQTQLQAARPHLALLSEI